ncbi:MAG: sugar nucleotide-binding protein [Pirellulaceae bacterium]|nr:sugar nucleotide-binding protein [Pirellulaceae bacterium]
MLLILGSSGYVGSALTRFLDSRGVAYRGLSRRDTRNYALENLDQIVRELRPDFLINAAGYTGKPNVDACELHRTECLSGNSVLPGVVRQVCEANNLAWGHISSGCIYSGARPDGSGFTEADPPNFDFRHNNCSFYSGCKALGEELLSGSSQTYIWRLRIPFNHQHSSRNYLSKLLSYDRLLDARNSVTDLDDFVRVCWECWQRQVPFGTYNITNPGSITTAEVVELIQQLLRPNKRFQFFESEQEFMRLAAKTPRSNCVLDTSKLLATGIEMLPVRAAIIRALENWSVN